MVGKAVPSGHHWNQLNLNHIEKAVINQDTCIRCRRCYVACGDTSHQAISPSEGRPAPFRDREDERGLQPVRLDLPGARHADHAQAAPGEVDAGTGRTVVADYANWTTHPNNPMRVAA